MWHWKNGNENDKSECSRTNKVSCYPWYSFPCFHFLGVITLPLSQVSKRKVKEILETGSEAALQQKIIFSTETNKCFNPVDQQNMQFIWSLILLQSSTWLKLVNILHNLSFFFELNFKLHQCFNCRHILDLLCASLGLLR